MRKDGFNLVGLAHTPTGVGEDLRMFAAMLDELGIHYSVQALLDNSRPMRQVQAPFRFRCDDRFEVSIFFLWAFATLDLKQSAPVLFQNQRLLIGYWPWELPHFPQDQIAALECTDMIWCPSRFVHDSYRLSTSRPISVLPLPTAMAPASQRDFRQPFGIAPQDFVVLYIYDAASGANRKNPAGTMQAFRAFAAAHEDAWLILKCHRMSPKEQQQLLRSAEGSRIVVLDESLDPADLSALYANADCYLSLHRSEGYGRTLVEALQSGLPVVTTDFSTPGELFSGDTAWLVKWQAVEVTPDVYPCSPASWWAEPDVADAARQLECVYRARSSMDRQRLRQAGQAFSVRSMARRYEAFLDACLQPQSTPELARQLEDLRGGCTARPVDLATDPAAGRP